MDYWSECIAEAFEDAKIPATKDQINTVASWAESAHDNYGMTHGHEFIENPYKAESERLKIELEKERSKSICSECNGRGRIVTPGPYHSSDSECWACRGDGRF